MNTSLRHYFLVGTVAAATLGLELIQTRILSFLYFNNVVYLTVTVVLLGFGISGVFMSLLANRFQRPERMISFLTVAFIFSQIICLSLVSYIPEVYPSIAVTINKLVISYMALVIPFLFAGAILGWIFMLQSHAINRLYGVDLACASSAIIAFILLLWPLGAEWFVWLCSGIVLLGFVIYSWTQLSKTIITSVVAVFLGALYLLHGNLLGKTPEAYKTMGRMSYDNNVHVEKTAWTPITRIDLWSTKHFSMHYFGMLSPQVLSSLDPDHLKILTQDADAITFFIKPDHDFLKLHNQLPDNLRAISLIYNLNQHPAQSLVIGVGGGVDMYTAKTMGAQQVTGVEINPATYSFITGPYKNYLMWPTWDGVKVIRAEGRNYIHAKQNQYDTIVMSGIDTFSALSSGAYVLSENYLYTVEAMKAYLTALKPNGTMGINRWFFLKPRETVRIASLYLQAAKELHMAHPEQSILVISDKLDRSRWASTFIKKVPYTQHDINSILSIVNNHPSLDIIYLPKIFPPTMQQALEKQIADRDPEGNFARNIFNQLMTSNDEQRQQIYRGYIYQIDPVYDDKPFFFQYYKENGFSNLKHFIAGLSDTRAPTVLVLLFKICLVLCVCCILLPLWIFQRSGLNMRGSVSLLLFFAALGFGFMMFEIGSMQMVNVYIGDPTYSLPLVLAALLIATGLGSLSSAKLTQLFSSSLIIVTCLAIMLSIFVWIVFTRTIQPLTMNDSLVVRSAIVMLALLPVGFLLGIPFPTAIKEIGKLYPPFIAWAWGINGITSVLGSIIAIIIAMQYGFTVVVMIAAFTYFIGMLVYWRALQLR